MIVHPASGRTLLHWHKRLNRWLQVGGHVEYETDIAQAALREAHEETGLPDLAHYPMNAARPCRLTTMCILFPKSVAYPEHLHLDFRYALLTKDPAALAPAERRVDALALAELRRGAVSWVMPLTMRCVASCEKPQLYSAASTDR